MAWVIPSIIATLTGTAILAFSYYYYSLFLQDRQNVLRIRSICRTKRYVFQTYIVLFSLLSFGLLFFFPSPALAETRLRKDLTQQEKEWLRQHQDNIKLCYEKSFPPIEFESPSGSFSGIGADIISLVEKRLGVNFSKSSFQNWDGLLAALKSGSCWLAPTIVKTSQRDQYADFTSSYLTIPVVIITKQDRETGLTLNDLTGQKIAVVSEYVTQDYLTERSKGRFEIIPVKSAVEGLRSVSFGQVDAYVESLAVAAYYINQESIPNLQVAGNTDYSFALRIAVSHEYPLLSSAVRKAVSDLTDAEVNKIKQRWISLKFQTGMSSKTKKLLIIAGVSIFFLLVVLIGFLFSLLRTLKLNETKFRAIFNHAPYSIVINHYEDGRFLDANPAFLTQRGLNKNDIVGMNLADISNTREIQTKEILDKLSEKGRLENLETQVMTKEGNYKHLIYSSVLLDLQGQKQVLSMTVDITEQKNAQAALTESEKRFKSLFLMAPLPLIEISQKEEIVHINKRFEDILGYQHHEIPTLQDLWESVYPDPTYRNHAVSLWKESVDTIHEEKITNESIEYEIRCKNDEVRTFIINTSLIGSNYLISFFDISEHKELESKLQQAQKMEALGTLSGGIAHDFNNILSSIFGFTELAKLDAEAGKNEELKKNLDQIMNGGMRAKDLVNHILNFSRKGDLKKHLVQITPLLKESVKFLKASISPDIEIKQNFKVADAIVMADAAHLHQILMNLFTNAAHAMKETGGVLEVSMDSILIEEDEITQIKNLPPGNYLKLCISDTGCGIPKSLIDRVFEPFFTTKERGEGTGMGLSTVYGILKDLGGTISVYSEINAGTTFQILLPEQKKGKARSDNASVLPLKKGEGKILIVDDEEAIIKWSKRLLQELGYEVKSKNGSLEALAEFERNPSYFDLVLTDMYMPEMNGIELSKKILSLNSNTPIVLCTGFSQGLTKEAFIQSGGFDVIMKPMIASELADVVYRGLKRTRDHNVRE